MALVSSLVQFYTYICAGADFQGLVTNIDLAVKIDWIRTPAPFKHLEFKSCLVCQTVLIDLNGWIIISAS